MPPLICATTSSTLDTALCIQRPSKPLWPRFPTSPDQVEGTEGDAAARLNYPNEPVVDNPTPLLPADLRQCRTALAEALQPGETVGGALRRLAGAGLVLEK
jgi:hypothetical protein